MRLMRTFTLAVLFVLIGTIVQPAVSGAISKGELRTILRNTAYYGDFGGAGSCGAVEGSGGDVTLSGADNIQKAFNYFKTKGLNDVQSAAIVANLIAESGVNPRSNQGGGGPGRGIAQWTASERWATLTGWAQKAGKNPLLLGTQLEFLWMELNGTPPAGNYKPAFEQFKQKSGEPPKGGLNQLQVATGFFMGNTAVRSNDAASSKFEAAYGRVSGFENPGIPHLDRRFQAATQVLKSYGSGNTDSALVVGGDAACGSVGAVDCESPDATTDTPEGLSDVRKNVVCIALAEVKLWDEGKKGPGQDFKLYSQGRDEEWCADFASWVYNNAGYPINGKTKGGNVASVSGVRDIGIDGLRFTYHDDSRYIPKPGDLAIYKNGQSHVNIVVSVNMNNRTMSTVGGNQDGSSRANTSSKVTQYTRPMSLTNGLSGYVSPKD